MLPTYVYSIHITAPFLQPCVTDCLRWSACDPNFHIVLGCQPMVDPLERLHGRNHGKVKAGEKLFRVQPLA